MIMIETAIELCKNVVEYISKRKEIKQDSKLRISILLDEISNTLLDTATNFENDIYPIFNCGLLEKMINHLHFYLIDYLPQEQIDELRNSLLEATRVEQEFTKRHEPNTIPTLKKSAGELKAMSLLLKL